MTVVTALPPHNEWLILNSHISPSSVEYLSTEEANDATLGRLHPRLQQLLHHSDHGCRLLWVGGTAAACRGMSHECLLQGKLSQSQDVDSDVDLPVL